MVKVALLIAVSQYEHDLPPLPATIKDVESMEQVLQNPNIGGFDDIKVLKDPQQHEMAVAIETLFDGREKDDLVLLYFSGHGIKDESGKLYFAARNSRKNLQGKLVESTTVAAVSVQNFMSKSRSKREVVILDCCFSGAFAEGMSAKDDGFVDVKNQLGGEGRAVLTSSTSTQYSFEQQGTDNSIYTHYIVEGLKTGAADRDEDGLITVDELHDYAAKKVQESTPAMKPEIYAVKEGYKIKLAKAPIDEPKLKYRREVEYWLEGGKGEISLTGRATLDALQENLKLSPEETAAIEIEVLAPAEIYKRKLQRYEQALLQEIESEPHLSQQAQNGLKRLQQVLALSDEDIALIEKRVIVPLPPTEPNPPLPRNKIWLNYIAMCIIGVIIGGISVYITQIGNRPLNSCTTKKQYISGDRISLGEEILLTQNTNADKEAGVQAFAKGDCQTAINKFKAYRANNITDPEALIYLNNAKARQNGSSVKIAVSVPIGESVNIAQEMLRGVAQAQDEVNNGFGINGKMLEVAIANDDNNPKIATDIADKFVKDSSILAVVGHNASRASINASQVYQQGGLVMISPTSYAQNITFSGNYIFLTAPNVNSITAQISDYAIHQSKKSNFLICHDQNVDNISVKESFVKVITATGGTINLTPCDISSSQFNPEKVLSQASSSRASALVLAFYLDKSRQKSGVGSQLVRVNQGTSRLALFGTPAIYTQESLEEGPNINDITISVPWHPTAFPNNPFTSNAMKLWGATVNWRTATSYDAALAIIKGLQQSNTREELQRTLHSPNFSVDGATGKFRFLASGERENSPVFLVKLQQKPTTQKYEFAPVK